MIIIILHNVHAKESRDLIESIPDDGNKYIVVDWYEVHNKHGDNPCDCVSGQPYKGPDPSAFPELVTYDENPPAVVSKDIKGKDVTYQAKSGWVRVRKAASITDIQDRAKYSERKDDPVKPVDANKEASQVENTK